jgi:hypothetical protein
MASGDTSESEPRQPDLGHLHQVVRVGRLRDQVRHALHRRRARRRGGRASNLLLPLYCARRHSSALDDRIRILLYFLAVVDVDPERRVLLRVQPPVDLVAGEQTELLLELVLAGRVSLAFGGRSKRRSPRGPSRHGQWP